MVKVKKLGQMVQFIKVDINPVKKMVAVYTCGTTAASMMACGSRTKSKAMVSILGLMDAGIRDSGSTIIWMVSVFIPGKMADTMKASIEMTKSTVTEFTPGVIIDNIEVIGPKASNTDLVLILCRNKKLNRAFGKKVNA